MNQLRRLLVAVFRGSDSGQSFVEYLTIVGACALVGIAGFTRYGQAVKSDLSADAKHIEGEGLPNTEGILGSLGADYNEIPGWCVKPNYCFAAGTPVQTEHGDRAIESIVVGDRVWARDVSSGAIALRRVVNTYRTARIPVVDLELSSGGVASEHLRVTRSHLFWVEGPGWVRADTLGAQPLWSTEQSTRAQINTGLIESDSEPTTVYNLEVSDFHSYFVGQSHVLVHNGNPNSDGCPTGTPPTAETPAASATPPKPEGIKCGESGSYLSDLGGWDAEARATSRPSWGLERDHIPSSQALKVRALKLMDDQLVKQIAERCQELTEGQQKELADAARAKAKPQLETEVHYTGFAIAMPKRLHYAGRTHGQNADLYERDALDLASAARDDVRALQALLAAGTVVDRKLTADCVAKLLAALPSVAKSNQEYDAQLGALAQAELERSGFEKTLADKCGAQDPQTESQRQ